MFVGTKVGEFTITQRHKLSPMVEVEEIFQGDVYKESAAAAQEEINASFKKFSEKYGIKTTTGTDAKKKASPKKAGADPNSELIQRI